MKSSSALPAAVRSSRKRWLPTAGRWPTIGQADHRAVGRLELGRRGSGGNCIFNVEGGHRAVMFHRFGGVQQGVRPRVRT